MLDYTFSLAALILLSALLVGVFFLALQIGDWVFGSDWFLELIEKRKRGGE